MIARRFVITILGACLLWGTPAHAGPDITVYAAASLTEALSEIEQSYAADTSRHIKLSFASSSTLAKQVEAGGGAAVFISADTVWMDYLETRHLIAQATRKPLVGNTLVLIVPANHPATLDLKPGGTWLTALPTGRIAVGDTAHVPAGIYAKEALTKLGVWDKVEPRLALADNVRSALVLVERGEAVAGIVYATDAAISKGVAIAATFPSETHAPIVYPAALTASAPDNPDARAFYDYLFGDHARAILTKHGFSRP